MRHSRPLPLLAVLLLAACAPGGAPPAATGAEETRLKKAFVALKGVVTAPTGLVGNDGASLIGNDGSTLVGNDGASLIGNDGSTLIGNDGSTLQPRALLAFTNAPLANAAVFVCGADGKPLKPLIKAKTDAQGRFTLTNVPAGRHVLIALGTTADKRIASVLGLVTAIKAEDGIALSAASSVVTGAVLAARAQGSLAEFDTPSYQRAVSLAEKGLAIGDAPDLTDRATLVAQAAALVVGDSELGKLLDTLKQQVAGQAPVRGALPTEAPAPPATPSPTPTPNNGTGLASGGTGTSAPSDSPTPPTTAIDTPAPADTPTPAPTAAPTAAAPVAAPDFVPRVRVIPVAGTGQVGSDNADFGSASFDRPESITVGTLTNTAFYVGEPAGRVRKLERIANTTSLRWTVPGMRPAGLHVSDAQLYVADMGRHQILTNSILNVFKVGLSTLAGANAAGMVEGSSAQARFNAPHDVWATNTQVFVADTGNGRIRAIAIGNDTVSTVVKDLNGPESIAVGPDGALWIADTGNHQIKKLEGGVVQVVAGGAAGFADGPGSTARFNRPTGLTVVGDELVVVDRGNRRLRLVSANGTVRTLAGTGEATSRTGTGDKAAFLDPSDADAFKNDSRIWVTDTGAHRIVEVSW